MLFGLVILLACWLCGETLVSLFGLPLPGNVAGMLILLVVSLARRGVGPTGLTASETAQAARAELNRWLHPVSG